MYKHLYRGIGSIFDAQIAFGVNALLQPTPPNTMSKNQAVFLRHCSGKRFVLILGECTPYTVYRIMYLWVIEQISFVLQGRYQLLGYILLEFLQSPIWQESGVDDDIDVITFIAIASIKVPYQGNA